jgi:hypothetical protein
MTTGFVVLVRGDAEAPDIPKSDCWGQGCLDAGHEVIYAWLSEHGYFGPKSDTLRAPGDRYY